MHNKNRHKGAVKLKKVVKIDFIFQKCAHYLEHCPVFSTWKLRNAAAAIDLKQREF